MTDEVRLKNAIIAAREALEETDAEAAWQRYAAKLAAAIIVEIKAAKVNYTNGLTAGSNAVIGTFNHTVS
jgi:hypothetical protein